MKYKIITTIEIDEAYSSIAYYVKSEIERRLNTDVEILNCMYHLSTMTTQMAFKIKDKCFEMVVPRYPQIFNLDQEIEKINKSIVL